MPLRRGAMACSRTPKCMLRPAYVPGSKSPHVLEVGLGRRIEVGRAADELGQGFRDRVHHGAAGVARCDAAVLGVERRPRQIVRAARRARALELRGEIGVSALPRRRRRASHSRVRFVPRGRALAEVREHVVGNEKSPARAASPAPLSSSRRCRRRAARRGRRTCPARGEPKPMCVRIEDERRPVGLGFGDRRSPRRSRRRRWRARRRCAGCASRRRRSARRRPR